MVLAILPLTMVYIVIRIHHPSISVMFAVLNLTVIHRTVLILDRSETRPFLLFVDSIDPFDAIVASLAPRHVVPIYFGFHWLLALR